MTGSSHMGLPCAGPPAECFANMNPFVPKQRSFVTTQPQELYEVVSLGSWMGGRGLGGSARGRDRGGGSQPRQLCTCPGRSAAGSQNRAQTRPWLERVNCATVTRTESHVLPLEEGQRGQSEMPIKTTDEPQAMLPKKRENG